MTTEYQPNSEYMLKLQLSLGGAELNQTSIEEIIEFGEEYKWIAQKHGINIDEYYYTESKVYSHTHKMNLTPEQITQFETDIINLANEMNIAFNRVVCKYEINNKTKYFTTFGYGWGETEANDEQTITSEWVGGKRGRPKTLDQTKLHSVTLTVEQDENGEIKTSFIHNPISKAKEIIFE